MLSLRNFVFRRSISPSALSWTVSRTGPSIEVPYECRRVRVSRRVLGSFGKATPLTAGTVTETTWDSVTITWDNGHVAVVHHGDMREVMRQVKPNGNEAPAVANWRWRCGAA